MQDFYVRVLGFEAHPDKSKWLRTDDGFGLHLMRSNSIPTLEGLERHFALQVASLQSVLLRLLAEGLEPFQASFDGGVHPVRDSDDALDFGIGSIFVVDPEHNIIDFLKIGRGLFAQIPRGASSP